MVENLENDAKIYQTFLVSIKILSSIHGMRRAPVTNETGETRVSNSTKNVDQMRFFKKSTAIKRLCPATTCSKKPMRYSFPLLFLGMPLGICAEAW